MANSPYAPKNLERALDAEKHEAAPLTNQEIDARAFFDSQTQAYNFRYILRRLEHELARAKYFDRSVAVLVISIDTIKRIPADWGHGPIDKALDLVAATLFSNSRPFDLIGRYTDDRFVLICPEASMDDVTKTAESIREACSVLQVKHQWQDLRLSVSIGIAISSAEFDDVESLIAIADVGADTVTQNGGNGFCFGADTL
jgi:diguanylate cyclase (GGDEF)-like protein